MINSQNLESAVPAPSTPCIAGCKWGIVAKFAVVPVVKVPTDLPFKNSIPVEDVPADVTDSRNVLVIPDTPLVIVELLCSINEKDIDGVDGDQYTLNLANALTSEKLPTPAVVTGFTTKNVVICPPDEKLKVFDALELSITPSEFDATLTAFNPFTLANE